MKRRIVATGTEVMCVKHQAKVFLKARGLRCPLKEIDVVVCGDQVSVSFIWAFWLSAISPFIEESRGGSPGPKWD